MSNYSEISLAEVIKKYQNTFLNVLSKWKIILAVTLLFGLIGLLYSAITKDKYTAQLNFVAENTGGGGLSAYAGIASQFGIDLGGSSGGAFEGDNLMELMKSKNLITKTLLSKYDNKNLMIEFYINNYKLNKKGIQLVFDSNYYNQNWVADSMINLVYERVIKKHLSVEKFDKKLDFVYIKFEDRNQFFAKKFVEVLANKTIDFYTDYKTKKNLANVSTIQSQIDSVRNLLYSNINEIAEVKDLNLSLTRQIPQAGRQKKEVSRQVNAAVYEELLKNSQIAKLIMLKETPLIKIIDTPILPIKNEKMGFLLSFIIFGSIGAMLISVWFVLSSIIIVRNNN